MYRFLAARLPRTSGLFGALFVLLFCNTHHLIAGPLPTQPAAVLAQLPHELKAQLQGGSIEGETLMQKGRLARFYQQRDYQSGWIAPERKTPDAEVLLSVLEQAEAEGLPAGGYHQQAIRRLVAQPAADAAALAKLDILLSDAFLAYSNDVRSGRFDPRSVDESWHIIPPTYYLERLLRYGLESDTLLATLHSMPPYQGGYRRLRRALQDYRAIAAQGGWTQLPAGPVLKRGMTEERVALLRRRLLSSGDLLDKVTNDEQTFDAALEMAVERFQLRHGLTPDGAVGEGTRVALNIPVETRIAQLRATMERWRWLPRHSDSRYLMVNMTGYMLDVIEGYKSVLQMRVIIGKEYRQTPVFDSNITEITFNPSWYVPPLVLRHDVLPHMKKDATFLARNNMEVLADMKSGGRVVDPATIEWGLYDKKQFPYAVRQGPGGNNPLGLVKFVLPNNHNVYLHDTPQRNLFSRRDRTFSSGCIRLEDPVALASYLLKHEEKGDAGAITDYLAKGRPVTVKLHQSWPVYLLYWTAWVDEDGVVQFRDDIYGRDTRLIAQMQPPANSVVSLNRAVQ